MMQLIFRSMSRFTGCVSRSTNNCLLPAPAQTTVPLRCVMHAGICNLIRHAAAL
jgi:hypothetical protein